MRYTLSGSLGAVAIPVRAPPERKDELWQHTCFEVFARAPGAESYVELNFSPSTQWAAYAFDRYREGMRALALDAPRVTTTLGADTLVLEALVALPIFSAAWRLGLSAVIEESDGRTSYWALAHPPGKPDFHHPDCFAAELGPSGSP